MGDKRDAKATQKGRKGDEMLLADFTKNLAKPKSEPLKGISNIPEGCPLRGGPVPDACRFHPKLFRRLVDESVLTVDGGCPIINVCKLKG